MSAPAVVTGASLLVMFVVIGASRGSYPDSSNVTDAVWYTTLAFLFVSYCLTVYSVNCFVRGECVVWGWFHAITFAFMAVLSVLWVFTNKPTSTTAPTAATTAPATTATTNVTQ